MNETPNLSDEIDRRIRAGWMGFKRYKREMYDRLKAGLLPLKARTVRSEVVKANEFVYLGGNVNHNADLSIEVDRCIRNAWRSFPKYTLKLSDRPSAPFEF